MASRRAFLAGLGTAVLAPVLGWAAAGSPAALAAAKTPEGTFRLVGLTAAGEIAFSLPLPARGHAGAAHPQVAEAVFIARRPGTFALILDCVSGRIRQRLEAPAGRHFYGHAAYSGDGRLLFTTENEIETGAGRIGVWDRTLGYVRIDEFTSGGIGPHEILRLPDGRLSVANGGIRTHPSTGREKLNLDTMRPNLAVFDTDGQLQDLAEVPTARHHNSLRHIAAAPDGTVVCGFQWQGDPFDAPPLVGFYAGDGRLRDGEMDEATLRGLDGYIGSVSALGATGFAAAAPRGGRVMTFDGGGNLTAIHSAPDGCGLAALPGGGCLVTTGFGAVLELTEETLKATGRHPVAFDNHVVALL